MTIAFYDSHPRFMFIITNTGKNCNTYFFIMPHKNLPGENFSRATTQKMPQKTYTVNFLEKINTISTCKKNPSIV